MKSARALEALGLTQMEALAYTYLVANPSSTGYRVARGIGKPTANVYRALESLERKGAVIHDRSATPSFRALSPGDLLTRFEHEFRERRTLAERELAALRPDEGDERFYALSALEPVLARVRLMLASARRLVWLDAPAEIAVLLAPEIQRERARGVRVVVESPAPVLRVVADAREALLAALSADNTRVRDAVWTRSTLFARTMHEALASNLLYAKIAAGLTDGLSVDEIEGAFEACRELRDSV